MTVAVFGGGHNPSNYGPQVPSSFQNTFNIANQIVVEMNNEESKGKVSESLKEQLKIMSIKKKALFSMEET